MAYAEMASASFFTWLRPALSSAAPAPGRANTCVPRAVTAPVIANSRSIRPSMNERSLVNSFTGSPRIHSTSTSSSQMWKRPRIARVSKDHWAMTSCLSCCFSFMALLARRSLAWGHR